MSWAQARDAGRTAPQKYGIAASRAAAPAPVQSLIVEHLRSLLGELGLEHDESLLGIARMVASRLSPSTWATYSSGISQFVRFCLEAGFDFLPASQVTGVMYAQHLAARGTIQASSAQPYFSAVNTLHDILGYPKPCGADNKLLASFRAGWERLQVRLDAAPTIVLAFAAESA